MVSSPRCGMVVSAGQEAQDAHRCGQVHDDAHNRHMLYVAFRVLTSSAAFVLVMAGFGLVSGTRGAEVLIAATLTGLAFATPAAAWAVGVRVQRQIDTAFRMVIMPLYMFPGTFFASSQLPGPVKVIVEALPLAQGVTSCRSLALGTAGAPAVATHAAYLCALTIAGFVPARRALAMVERNMMMYRRSVTPLAFGLVEPVMYLLTIGFGVGSLVGTVPGVNVRYPAFVAPAILATTAMNTSFNQTSFGIFSRVKVDLTYQAIVPTPLSAAEIAAGEVARSRPRRLSPSLSPPAA
jgi:hypothetical protein